ncbi:gas vesicle protein GvpG [Nocardiopsis sp. RSe5-2]|uniref:Gas vesicle protein GvpG n=1 Tax=Nocardiopsis endophytica TaxID=3018445 RepID=A0ABT4UDF0_9ACTN|nr:gas vesicle protein GvpG [Nocardiopsis endophytica]MDA2814912.1 gas vesicle protein GvpG [Nocardiopsis endophytica]
MGLLTAVLTAPAAPVRLALWAARTVRDAAEREYYDPDRIMGELRRLSDRLEAGEIGEEEFDRAEDELLDRLEEAQRLRGAPEGGGFP